FFLTRRFKDAVAACESAHELDPNFIVAIYIEAMALAQMGKLSDAILLAERAVALSERAPFYLGLLGNFHARAGDREKVRELNAELEQLASEPPSPTKRYVPPHAFAYLHAGLQDIDRAIEWEAKAHDDGASPFNNFSPVIDNLHNDPRHVAELRRMGWKG